MAERYAPENIHPADQMMSLECNERYSVVARDDLGFYYPYNSTNPRYTLSLTAVKPISTYFPTLMTANITRSKEITALIVGRLGQHAVGCKGMWAGETAYPRSLIRYIYQPGKPVDLPGRFAALGASMINDMR